MGKKKTVAGISVTAGPGSFTSLRIGLATAKSMAFAWRIPIVGFDSLEILARATWKRLSNSTEGVTSPYSRTEYLIVPVLNAFRKQVFSAVWKVSGSECTCLRPSSVSDASEWQSDPALGAAQGSPVFLVGSGLEVYRPRECQDQHILPTPSCTEQLTQLSFLGQSAIANGQAGEAHSLLPNYIRGSAAEEKKDQS